MQNTTRQNRFVATALLLGSLITLGSASSFAADGKAILFIALAGLFGGLSWLWGFLALQTGGDVTAVNAIDRLSIVLILIFAVFFLGEHFTWQKFAGVILVALGVILVTMSREQLVTLFRSFL